jgi:hypothetical protein
MGSILSSRTHPEDSISAIRLIFSTGGKISFDVGAFTLGGFIAAGDEQLD